MIKLIIFDLGGVIHSNVHNLFFKRVSSKANIPFSKITKAHKSLIEDLHTGKINENQYWHKLFKKLKTKYHKFSWEYRFTRDRRINYSIISLIKKLKKRYKLCLISNTIPQHAKYNKNIFKLFNYVILSYKVRLFKPDKRIYKLALKKFKVKSNEVVFIDDLRENLYNAKKIGMNVIHYTHYNKLRKDLNKLLRN